MLKPASATRGGKGKTRWHQLDPGNQFNTGKVFLDAIHAEAETKEREKEEKEGKKREKARLAEEKKKKAEERKKKKRDAKGKAKGPTSTKEKEDWLTTQREGLLLLQDLLQIERQGRNCWVVSVIFVSVGSTLIVPTFQFWMTLVKTLTTHV